jgi:hypothetical protein
LSEPAAIAPMVARQVSSTATNPGMDAPGQKPILNFRQRVERYATSRPTRSAGRTDCSWVRDTTKSGGIAAACPLEESCPGRRFRSPKSGNQDVASSYRRRRPPWVERFDACRGSDFSAGAFVFCGKDNARAVIARSSCDEAIQCFRRGSGLLRRYAPRNDEKDAALTAAFPTTPSASRAPSHRAAPAFRE